MSRVYNFSAGPSALPVEVLEKAQSELVEYQTSGMSVMEMSHRSAMYEEIIQGAESLLRELMNIPSNYKVLFLQGGASSQFAMIPMNLSKNKKADYVITGLWAKKAASEAEKYLSVNRVASSADKTFSYIPELDKASFDPDADYVHITSNNTIYGTRFTSIPDTGDVPLVADISSNILGEQIDVEKYGILYAGAQKNLGPAGVTVVIVRDDLIGDCIEGTPTMFQYKIHAEAESMYNTPPTYAIYILKLVLEWAKAQGGVSAIEKINIEKANILYDYLDESKLFSATVDKKDRSLMNVPFVTGNADLDAIFVKEATASGLLNLKGHRSVGGMRASIYNGMTKDGVIALVNFMKEFENKHK